MKLFYFAFSLLCLEAAHGQVSIISDDFSSGSIHTLNAGDFGSVGVGRSQGIGTWSLKEGSLINTGTDERSLGYIVDVSSLAIDHTYNTLKLSFDFRSTRASESLFVHIYGYQSGGVIPKSKSSMINLDGTKGNAWTTSSDQDTPSRDWFIVTNFVNGAAQGVSEPYRGEASGALKITGGAGSQSFEQDFSLSRIVSGGATHLDDYDYIALVFGRSVAGVPSEMAIDNLNLSVASSDPDAYVDIPESSTYAFIAGLFCFSLVVVRRRFSMV